MTWEDVVLDYARDTPKFSSGMFIRYLLDRTELNVNPANITKLLKKMTVDGTLDRTFNASVRTYYYMVRGDAA